MLHRYRFVSRLTDNLCVRLKPAGEGYRNAMRIRSCFRIVSGWALASLVSSCLHQGGVVFGQPPTTGGGMPAPALGVGEGSIPDPLHAGGVAFGKEPTREQWLDLVSNQSGSIVGAVDGPERGEGTTPSGSESDLPFDALRAASLSIRIRTLDPLGNVLSGVEIEAYRQVMGTSVRLVGVTDASGSLDLDLGGLKGLSKNFLAGPDLFLPVFERFTNPVITCRDPRTGQMALLAEPWRQPTWDLRLGQPAILSGRVRGPIKEVGIPGTPYRSTVDASGSWSIGDVPGGRYVLTARTDLGAGATASVTVIPADRVEVPVLEEIESGSGGSESNPGVIDSPRGSWPKDSLEPGTSEDSTTGAVSVGLPQ
jgi:hypothetical protein